MSASINDSWGGGARPEPNEPGRVEWRAAASGETRVEQGHNLLQAAAREHRAFLDRFETVAHQFTQDGLKAQLGNFVQSDAGQVPDAVEQLAANVAAEAESAYASKIRGLDQLGDAATESHKGRFSRTLERQMDRAPEGERATLAAKLIAENADDPAALGVIYTEADSYGVPESVIRQALTEARPELGEAEAKVTKAQQSAAIMRNSPSACGLASRMAANRRFRWSTRRSGTPTNNSRRGNRFGT
jgi:hypothetical protein